MRRVAKWFSGLLTKKKKEKFTAEQMNRFEASCYGDNK